MRRLLLIAGVTIAALYLVACGVVAAAQRSFIYFPQPAPVRGAMERFGLRLVDAGGTQIELLHLPAAPGAPTVVHFHGNAEQLFDLISLGEEYRARGLGFAAIEYPGYGRAPGEPSEQAIYAAAEAGLRFLATEGVTPARTVLSGRSLGTGVATEMATRGFGARLVLISPYTSLPAVGARQFSWLPVGLLMSDRFDTVSKAKELTLPVLIVHGERDELIPVQMGRTLAKTFPHAGIEVVPARGHNDVLEAPGVVEGIASFALGGG